MADELSLGDALNAYANGYFPMADSAEALEFHWYDPPVRGQLPIEALHVPKRLRQTVLRGTYDVRIDTAFEQVIDGCAAATPERPKTWINRNLRDMFIKLHEAGFAHSVECWKDGALAGGVYGLALGGAFCAESKFSLQRDASKVALVHLCARLWRAGFSILDAQFVNDHLRQFGIYEIMRDEYKIRLRKAVHQPADFRMPDKPSISEIDLVRSYIAKTR